MLHSFFSSFFRGRLDSQKTLLAGECPKFTRPDLFQSFFGLKWSLRHASFESGHGILSCDYLLTCRLSVVLELGVDGISIPSQTSVWLYFFSLTFFAPLR